MPGKVTAELVREHGSQLQRLDIGPQRADELAIEVERLNSAVTDAAQRLDFNDEPAKFSALLLAAGQPAKAGR